MTRFLLIRHAETIAGQGSLSGRAPGVGLSEAGRQQALRLRGVIPRFEIERVVSSPVQRAHDTARLLVCGSAVPLGIDEAFTELDYGDWTGASVQDLKTDPLFCRFNTERSRISPPNGEPAAEAQARAVKGIETLAAGRSFRAIAVVTHAEIVRLILSHYGGFHLDMTPRFRIDHASVSGLAVCSGWSEILFVNRAPDCTDALARNQ